MLLAPAVDAEVVGRFDFTKDGNAAGRPAYDPAHGFGFDPAHPARFSVRVPEGNYRVVMRFGPSRERQTITIRSELDRLMVEALTTGGLREVSLVANVRRPELPPLPANATGGARVSLSPDETHGPTWDDRLSLAMDPWPSSLIALDITRASVPTLYLAGDSTVADQHEPYGSWGQYLPALFRPSIAVANHARSGGTLKSFVSELRFDKLLSTLLPGDWVMIQFGHNDQKMQWPQTYLDPAGSYRAWLRTYVAEIRQRGATPLLVTSPERRNFDQDGRIRPTLAEYAEAMRVVARDERVALLDLRAMSVALYEALGPALAPRAFADGGADHTHHNEYGARQLARALVQALRDADPARTGGLEKHIAPRVEPFDPARPLLPR